MTTKRASLKKIIHLSDPHVGYGEAGQYFRRFTERLREVADGHAGDYVVVITGDLVHSAREESYREAAEEIETLRRAGFHSVLVIPGNHDYRSGTDRFWRRRDAANIGRFQRVFFGAELEYPKLDILPAGGGPDAIAFIGLDTMSEVFRRRDAVFERGEFCGRQLARLWDLLRRDDVRGCGRRVLYFHHHPFGDFPLPGPGGAAAFREVIDGAAAAGVSIDALLYGHTHQGESRNGAWGIPRCYNAGTVTHKPRPKAIDWFPAFRPNSATRLICLVQPPESDIFISRI